MIVYHDPSATMFLRGGRHDVPVYTVLESSDIIEEGSTTPMTSYDANILRSEESTVDYGGIIDSSLDTASTFVSQNPSVGTVAESGKVSRVSDGTVRVTCTSESNIQLVTVPVSREVGEVTDTLVSWVSGTMASGATNAVGAMIEGLTPSGTTLNIFSSINHSTGAYTRNTSMWCASFATKLTACSVWNSRTSQQFGCTLITPRHFASCDHGDPVQVGDTVRWVSSTNVTYNRTVLAVYNIPGSDIRIGALSSDIGAGVTPAKVLPDYWGNYLVELRFGVPCILRNQFGEARIYDLISMTSEHSAFRIPSGDRTTWYRQLVPGDSGGPALLPVGSDVALVTTWYTSGSGPSYHSRNWATIIPTVDTLAGISTGYTPTVADLSAFTDFS